MKKAILILFSVVTLFGCVEAPKTENANEAPSNNLDAFVADFKVKNLNWSQNEIIEKKINKTFAKSLDSFLRTDKSLDEVKFKIESINEYKKGKYSVKLTNDEKHHVELIGLINESLIGKLKENEIYLIKGKYIKNLQDIKPYYNYGMWNVDRGLFKALDEEKVYLGVNLYNIEALN